MSSPSLYTGRFDSDSYLELQPLSDTTESTSSPNPYKILSDSISNLEWQPYKSVFGYVLNPEWQPYKILFGSVSDLESQAILDTTEWPKWASFSDHVKDSTPSSQKDTFTTTFPPEIRNMIYSYVLAADYVEPSHHLAKEARNSATEMICAAHHDRERTSTEQKATPDREISSRLNLLTVSRQIRDEALPVLYRENTFRIALNVASLPTKRYSPSLYTSIQNLHIDIEFLNSKKHRSSSEHALLPLAKFFSGVHSAPIPRKSCHILLVLNGDPSTTTSDRLAALRFTFKMAGLRVFERVSVEISYMYHFFCIRRRQHDYHVPQNPCSQPYFDFTDAIWEGWGLADEGKYA